MDPFQVTPVQISFEDLRIEITVPRPNPPNISRSQAAWRRIMFSIRQKFSSKRRRRNNDISMQKVLLDNVTGTFRPGRLSVILGPSGSGKTILLNMMAGRLERFSGAKLSGSLSINQERVAQTNGQFDSRFMTQIAGYVEQDDIILNTMTIEEAIFMSLTLRQPSLSAYQRSQQANLLIRELHLEKARGTMIGTATKKGVSGGERKRTSIAMELAANPALLFLDEPTSGLDAFSQLNVIKMLKKLALQGRTVIATVHAPSSDMLQLFDDMLVLVDGGLIYHGPAQDLIEYFNRLNFQFPNYANPLDYLFLDIIYPTAQTPLEIPLGLDQRRIHYLKHRYITSDAVRAIRGFIEYPTEGGILPSMLKEYSGFWRQLTFLTARSAKNLVRNAMNFWARFIAAIILSVFLALVYLDIKHSSKSPQQILNDLAGALFFVVINMFFASYNSVLMTFNEERTVFLKEYVMGYYSLPSYFLSKLAIEIPFQILFPIIYAFIIYWIIGFRPGFQYFLLLTLFLILVALCAAALGLAAGSLFKNVSTAIAIAPFILLPMVIYGGFFVTSANSPAWLAWIQWVSPVQYAFTGIMISQLSGLDINGVPGDTYLDTFGLNDRFGVGVNVAMLVALLCGFLVLAFLGLWKIVVSTGLSRFAVRKIRRQVLRRAIPPRQGQR